VWVWPFKQYTEVTIEPQIFKKKKRKCFYIFNFVLGLVSSQAWKSLSRSFPLVKETNLDHPGLLNLPEFICFVFFLYFCFGTRKPRKLNNKIKKLAWEFTTFKLTDTHTVFRFLFPFLVCWTLPAFCNWKTVKISIQTNLLYRRLGLSNFLSSQLILNNYIFV
jgi:hypothetical protein